MTKAPPIRKERFLSRVNCCSCSLKSPSRLACTCGRSVSRSWRSASCSIQSRVVDDATIDVGTIRQKRRSIVSLNRQNQRLAHNLPERCARLRKPPARQSPADRHGAYLSRVNGVSRSARKNADSGMGAQQNARCTIDETSYIDFCTYSQSTRASAKSGCSAPSKIKC